MSDNTFSSMDKLVEFGMGMAVANQMMKTMSSVMEQTVVPQASNQIAPPAIPQFYAVVNGAQAGPLNPNELSMLIARGDVGPDTLVWAPGMSGWMQAVNVPEINKLILLNTPANPGCNQ